MNVIKQVVVLLALALWLPAMNHCSLETVGLIPIDECCASEEPSSDSPISGHSCEEGCKLIEEAGYKLQDNNIHSVIPVLTLLFEIPLPEETAIFDAPLIDTSPSKTLYLPQFVIQTALPIRAPSVAS